MLRILFKKMGVGGGEQVRGLQRAEVELAYLRGFVDGKLYYYPF